ncbi:MAG: ABC transporter permease [Phycisphaerales bacterium]|nr:MAG: ABC transporter permease [Phycisphaerales bacterium]
MDAASRGFLVFYVKSQLKLKYRYTCLGFLWNFLEPALYLIVLSTIFSVVNRMNIQNYAVFLFGALVPWRYFEQTVNSTMVSIVGGEWLLKKMYVSPFTFPLTRWSIASIEFLFSFVVVLLIFAFLKKTWTVHLVILPLSIIPWAILGLGVGLMCAVLFTFFRDVRPIVQMLLMFVFFSSPILFRRDLFAEHTLQAMLLGLHPITYFAALFQKPVYYGAWPSWKDWAITFAVGSVALAFGFYLTDRFKEKFYFYL